MSPANAVDNICHSFQRRQHHPPFISPITTQCSSISHQIHRHRIMATPVATQVPNDKGIKTPAPLQQNNNATAERQPRVERLLKTPAMVLTAPRFPWGVQHLPRQ